MCEVGPGLGLVLGWLYAHPNTTAHAMLTDLCAFLRVVGAALGLAEGMAGGFTGMAVCLQTSVYIIAYAYC